MCLLYVLREPLNPEALIEAGDDASRVQWFSVESLQSLPFLAFNHIRLLRMALRQFFTSYYHDAVGMQEIEACQCEVESAPGYVVQTQPIGATKGLLSVQRTCN